MLHIFTSVAALQSGLLTVSLHEVSCTATDVATDVRMHGLFTSQSVVMTPLTVFQFISKVLSSFYLKINVKSFQNKNFVACCTL